MSLEIHSRHSIRNCASLLQLILTLGCPLTTKTGAASPLNLSELARRLIIVLKSVVAPQSRTYQVAIYLPSGDFASALIVSSQPPVREKPQAPKHNVNTISQIRVFMLVLSPIAARFIICDASLYQRLVIWVITVW